MRSFPWMFTKSDRGETNVALILFPMHCHLVGSGITGRTLLAMPLGCCDSRLRRGGKHFAFGGMALPASRQDELDV